MTMPSKAWNFWQNSSRQTFWRHSSTVSTTDQATGEMYTPQTPTEPQQRFLDLECEEALFGGSAGGGKSSALLMGALQHVHVSGYAALLLRKTYADLSLPGALMDRALEWLHATDATWSDKTKTWTFPSGATLTFGYLENQRDHLRYQGAEFQYIGFDELTQFPEHQYRYLLSRLRRLKTMDVPIRMRAASNPGGIGHEWVKQRFVVNNDPQRVFVPARLEDNPYLDQEEYRKALAQLDHVTRAQLERGDWDVSYEGGLFKRQWFDVVRQAPDGRRVRYWDKAATPDGGDYTVGVRLCRADDVYYVEDVIRGQWSPGERDTIIRQTAAMDGHGVAVWLEQEPGSSGVDSAQAAIRMLAGYNVHVEKVTGSKFSRAQPVSSQAEGRNIKLVAAAWNADFLNELCAFPNGAHDDQVDALSGAFNHLQTHPAGQRRYTSTGGVTL
jgi:predicted phage terminase large subunit-like protein